nr:MAG TPA: hypothetical protein [Caudoviricetes sp.]
MLTKKPSGCPNTFLMQKNDTASSTFCEIARPLTLFQLLGVRIVNILG